MKIETVKDYYDQHVINKLSGFVYGNKRVDMAWQELNNWIPEKLINVLEVGCGIGDISWEVSQKFPEVKILGFDVSEESINTANKLFSSDNITFLQADDISLLKIDADIQFDLIYLIDVYEHIPIDKRQNLFQFINKHLRANGVVFISCPTIAHQQYLRQNNPDGLQPIDENITINEVIEISQKCNLPILFFKEVSVWRCGDYLHAVFGKRKFEVVAPMNTTPSISIKKILLDRFLKNKDNEKDQKIKYKLELVEKKLGENVYNSLKK